jgi:multicomponent K+:H+ antiporter subunit E
MIARLLPHPALTALLFGVWVVMANDWSFATLLLGLAIALGVAKFTDAYWPDRPKIDFASGLAYVGVVLWDIIIANFEVAGIILFKPNDALRPAWLAVPLDLARPEAITVLAGTISLTPGTVSVDISACGRFLLVHALHAPDPEADIARIKARYEARLQRIFA